MAKQCGQTSSVIIHSMNNMAITGVYGGFVDKNQAPSRRAFCALPTGRLQSNRALACLYGLVSKSRLRDLRRTRRDLSELTRNAGHRGINQWSYMDASQFGKRYFVFW